MLLIENMYRRIAYSFGLALLITASFIDAERIIYLPKITWVVAVVLFVLSWKVQKEYSEIMKRIDGPDAKPSDPIAWFVGDQPHIYHFIWAAIYTFGTYVVVAIPIDWFLEETRQWRPLFICGLIVLFTIARLVDPKVRSNYYHKNS